MFRGKQKFVTIKPSSVKRDIPDGLWTKCDRCAQLLYNKELGSNLKVCPKCGYHFRMTARERLAVTCDEDSFVEHDQWIASTNPLQFPGYAEKLSASRARTGLHEAVVTGEACIGGIPVMIGVMDFEFVGASMGVAVGEKITRLFEGAASGRLPVVVFAASGGARMQEGIFSLMQMAKTGAAVARLGEERVPYVSVLTNPTTAGVLASFASQGDIVIAEPGALIGFAGPLVIEQTIGQRLPPGFQTAEFVCEHGMVDMVVDRRELRDTLIRILSLHAA